MERGPSDGGSRPNAWHQRRGRGGGSANPQNHHAPASSRVATGGGGGGNGGFTSKRGAARRFGPPSNMMDTKKTVVNEKNGTTKFEEAKSRMEEAVQKHMTSSYESSDEEEDVQVDPIVGAVLQSYSAFGGGRADLGRTQHFLEEMFQSGAATCLICIGTVKRIDPVWSCSACYCFLHLSCTQRWAKDSLLHQKQALEEFPREKSSNMMWPCPKCRKEYDGSSVPQKYLCFCGQKEDPPYHPWLVPHSCGETCTKPLQPSCGHTCLLLCHPGPCPPCPKTVRVSCHCGKQHPRPQRCSQKSWSCGSECGAILSCGSHRCALTCHPGLCEPCPYKSEQFCACGSMKQSRPCSSPLWHCDRVCGKILPCSHHFCEKVCHSGPCGSCPLSENRTCPCGKRIYKIPCTEKVLPCGDTCSRLLDCGIHSCPERCHRDKCGTCLEMTVKWCRCGKHQKELPCAKEFLCETKCKRNKNCGRHSCNRKCCDGQCPPCEKPCGRTLTCGQHKCESVCHRGPCYPCPVTATVSCNCGSTAIHVPCGRQRKTRAPVCTKLCLNPPECHHEKRDDHPCHFGHCPACTQVCHIQHSECGHHCNALCHTAVWIKVEQQAPSGPWELVAPQLIQQSLPCPPCSEPVEVVCLGGHDTSFMPCHAAKSMSCGRKCGQLLKCRNHLCSLECHVINDGDECESCERACEFPRPKGCSHDCSLPCHPAPCPPCQVTLRPRCHCGVTQLFIKCCDWTQPSTDQVALLCCGNPCPKSFPCGHKCLSLCHGGDCPDAEKCYKKTKVYCPCRRIKKEVRCDIARSIEFSVECGEACNLQIIEREKLLAEEAKRKQIIEEEKARIEAERFQKRIEGTGRRKNRGRNHNEELLEEEEARTIADWFHKRIERTGRRKNCGRNHNEVVETQNRFNLFYVATAAVSMVFIAILYLQWS